MGKKDGCKYHIGATDTRQSICGQKVKKSEVVVVPETDKERKLLDKAVEDKEVCPWCFKLIVAFNNGVKQGAELIMQQLTGGVMRPGKEDREQNAPSSRLAH